MAVTINRQWSADIPPRFTVVTMAAKNQKTVVQSSGEKEKNKTIHPKTNKNE